MIRKTLFILISGLLLTACNTPKKEKQETTDNAPETKIATTDAITGASSEPAIILNISKRFFERWLLQFVQKKFIQGKIIMEHWFNMKNMEEW